MDTSGQGMAPEPIAGLGEFGAEAGRVLRTAWEAIPVPLIAFDTNQDPVFANSAAESLLTGLGVSLRPNLRKQIKFFDAATQELLPPEKLPVARAMRGEHTGVMEILIRPVNPGTCFWVACEARPFYWNGPELRGVVLVFRDVTAHKRRELSRDSVEQLSEFIYQGNLAAIIRTNVDGRIIDCNDALVTMLGYSSPDELRTLRSPQLYWNPADRERLLIRLEGLEEIRETEMRLRRKDGSLCWALVNIRLLDPQPGQTGGDLVTTAIDITERKNWEETLRQSEARFTAFMRHLPGVAFIKDLNGRYVYYNEASWPQFRKHPEEIVGKTDEEIWPAEDAARYRENDAAVIAGGRPVEFIEPLHLASGVRSWLICKFPITENGRVALVGGIGFDVTDRTSLEEQLTQARKMEALGRLAGGVAHDFNNLLTVISGYGQLALESIGSSSADRLGIYVQEILNSARRASGMTGQLLAFSRRQSVQPRVLDLGEVLRNVEHLLQRMIGEHVNLHVRYGHEPCLIRADPHQIEQILMNLAANARDAMPLGGLLEIECSVLATPIERSSSSPLTILLDVRDTGIGMDESVKAQMFEPFFTSKDKGKGTGLGLSTVYGVVSQAGGEIEVNSQPGEGTHFRIYFPKAVGELDEASSSPGDVAPVGLETVLLVEDEPGVRLLAETILRKLGYKLLVADCGEAALELWNQNYGSIDILLTDVIMPQMSGGDLAHKLREKNPRLKILFMSGYTDDMIASHGVLAGETQLIQKPFTAEALGRRLRGVLDA